MKIQGAKEKAPAKSMWLSEKEAKYEQSDVPDNARSDPREQVLLRWGIGIGTLREDNRGVTFEVQMYKLDGSPDGTALVTSETTKTLARFKELLTPPTSPNLIPADPYPVEHMETESFGKARWTFPDDSTLTALGVGTSNLMLFANGDNLTAEVLAMVITDGTGRYEGARGLWTINRSVLGTSLHQRGSNPSEAVSCD